MILTLNCFLKGFPWVATGCTLRHGLGPGLKGKAAVKKGAEPEKVLPFRVPEPSATQNGMKSIIAGFRSE